MSIMCIVLLTLIQSSTWLQATVVADKLGAPFAVAFDAKGNTYYVEFSGHRLGILNARNQPLQLAGSGMKGDHDGQASTAALNSPHNLAIAPDGVIYLADTFNHKIKKYVPRTRELTTFAGTGKSGFSGDEGTASAASFNETYHVTLDHNGQHLYVADLKNQRIRRIELSTGHVITVAGNGNKGQPSEGMLATRSPLNDPRAIIVDKEDQLYILQRGGHDLWKVDTTGKLVRLAGTGKKGYYGDGGPAHMAQLNGPKHLCFDQAGNILIADTENHCIRRVNRKTGIIDLVAGRGKDNVPGNALAISLKQPHGVTLKPGTNEIYIADSSNNRIIKLVPQK